MKTRIKMGLCALGMGLLGMLLLTACGDGRRVALDTVPGTYVSAAKSEYSIARDTLLIAAVEHTPGVYTINRRTGFRRILSGKLGLPEYRSVSFSGVWDQEKRALQITQNGLLILFPPDGNSIRVQNSTYRKL
jgi:hypothetical protein